MDQPIEHSSYPDPAGSLPKHPHGCRDGGHERLVRENARLREENARLREAERAAQWAATHDPLTGLLNRAGFHGAVIEQLQHIPGGWPVACLVIDLDRFKPVNDLFGHHIGDAVLVEVAHRLTTVDRLVAARLGGDEFVGIISGHSPDQRWLGPTVKRIARSIAVPISVGNVLLEVTASVGLAHLNSPSLLNETLRRADLAMLAAKRTPDRVVCWEPGLEDKAAPDRIGRIAIDNDATTTQQVVVGEGDIPPDDGIPAEQAARVAVATGCRAVADDATTGRRP